MCRQQKKVPDRKSRAGCVDKRGTTSEVARRRVSEIVIVWLNDVVQRMKEEAEGKDRGRRKRVRGKCGG